MQAFYPPSSSIDTLVLLDTDVKYLSDAWIDLAPKGETCPADRVGVGIPGIE